MGYCTAILSAYARCLSASLAIAPSDGSAEQEGDSGTRTTNRAYPSLACTLRFCVRKGKQLLLVHWGHKLGSALKQTQRGPDYAPGSGAAPPFAVDGGACAVCVEVVAWSYREYPGRWRCNVSLLARREMGSCMRCGVTTQGVVSFFICNTSST